MNILSKLVFRIIALICVLGGISFAEELSISQEVERMSLLDRVIEAGNYDKFDPLSIQRMRAAFESIETNEMPMIASELVSGMHRGSFWVLRVMVAKMVAFDSAKVLYDREVCIEAIVAVLEEEEDEREYSQLLLALKGLNDSRVMLYVKERDDLADSSAIHARAELLDGWHKQVGKGRVPRVDRTDLEEERSGEVRFPRSMDADADENSIKKKPILIAFTVMLIAVCAWVIQRFRRVA